MAQIILTPEDIENAYRDSGLASQCEIEEVNMPVDRGDNCYEVVLCGNPYLQNLLMFGRHLHDDDILIGSNHADGYIHLYLIPHF